MKQYQQLLQHIIDKGRTKKGRGIHPMKCIFGYQMRFDLRRGFPIVTTRKMAINWMIHELIWFISGKNQTLDYLKKKKVRIWDAFEPEDGKMGPMYGYQWRFWPDYKGGHIDQLAKVIEKIKTDPDSATLIVSAWNAAQVDEMRLPPCHTFFQFDVRKGKLRMQLYQRSSDVFLGLPYNIFEYALLLKMVAKLTNTVARELIVTIGDAHLYHNQIKPAEIQIKRKPYPLPKLELNPEIKNIDDFKRKDIKLIGYKYHPQIKVPIVVV